MSQPDLKEVPIMVIKGEAEEYSAVLHDDVQVKLERPDRGTETDLHELYRDHEFKEEMFIGPVMLQKSGPSVVRVTNVLKHQCHCDPCDISSFSSQMQHECTLASNTSPCDIEKQGQKSMDISGTSGDSLQPIGQVKEVQRTLGGTLRLAKPQPSVHLGVEDVLDMSEEKSNDLSANQSRWLEVDPAAVGAAQSEGQVDAPISLVATAPVEEGSGDPQRIARSPHLGGPSIERSVPQPASADADVGLSTSGMTTTSTPARGQRISDGSDFDSDHDDEFDVVSIENNAIVGGIVRDIPDNNELDINEAAFINNLERDLDETVDNLPGVSDSWTWEEDYESFRGFPETFSGPTPGPLVDYDTPYDAFVDIWDEGIIELIVQQTNRFASQEIDKMRARGTLKPTSRLHHWVPTNVDEIMVLFAVYMYMGIDPRTYQREYWRSCSRLHMPHFASLMTYDRYILLSKFLHFIDNTDVGQHRQENADVEHSAKLKKIMPVILHLNLKFSTLYNLERNVAIDESLTFFKGRLPWIQAIRTKAARFNIKSYELCESRTGYMLNFQIYTGKSSATSPVVPSSADLALKSIKVVLELLRTLQHRGHCVTMDNFYNCPSLARYLKSLGIDCLGTLRRSRKNVPDVIRNAEVTGTAKGTIIARQSGDVSIVMWKDVKLVTMISTCHDASTYEGTRDERPQVKPVCVRDYDHIMGGINLKDQKLSMYLVERKRGVKWYMTIFKRLLNVSIHNAFIMHIGSLKRCGMPILTQREFRYQLAAQLDERHCRSQPRGSEEVGTLMRLRNVMHVPHMNLHERRRCVVCQRQNRDLKVRTECATCEEFMCLDDCWVEWHSLAVLNGREIFSRLSRKRSRNQN